jgi:hypothetical protein
MENGVTRYKGGVVHGTPQLPHQLDWPFLLVGASIGPRNG